MLALRENEGLQPEAEPGAPHVSWCAGESVANLADVVGTAFGIALAKFNLPVVPTFALLSGERAGRASERCREVTAGLAACSAVRRLPAAWMQQAEEAQCECLLLVSGTEVVKATPHS